MPSLIPPPALKSSDFGSPMPDSVKHHPHVHHKPPPLPLLLLSLWLGVQSLPSEEAPLPLLQNSHHPCRLHDREGLQLPRLSRELGLVLHTLKVQQKSDISGLEATVAPPNPSPSFSSSGPSFLPPPFTDTHRNTSSLSPAGSLATLGAPPYLEILYRDLLVATLLLEPLLSQLPFKICLDIAHYWSDGVSHYELFNEVESEDMEGRQRAVEHTCDRSSFLGRGTPTRLAAPRGHREGQERGQLLMSTLEGCGYVRPRGRHSAGPPTSIRGLLGLELEEGGRYDWIGDPKLGERGEEMVVCGMRAYRGLAFQHVGCRKGKGEHIVEHWVKFGIA